MVEFRDYLLLFCSNGVSRSGTFYVLMYSWDQFKAEQKANIFQTVKKMRT